MGFHLHECMHGARLGPISTKILLIQRWIKKRCLPALHDGSIVCISDNSTLGLCGMSILDHAKKRFILLMSINNPLRIEYFMTAVLAVGLPKHDEFDIIWVAIFCFEGGIKIIHLIVRQGQTQLLVGLYQGMAPLCQ